MASSDGKEPSHLNTESAATPAAPLRQDQVQNAVAFLQHPKVRDSSDESKRSFLERKGLTTAEIDAAFGNVKNGGGGIGQQLGEPPLPSPSQTPSPYSWSKAFMGVTVIAAGVFALQKYALPWVREWTKRRTTEDDAPSTSQLKLETHQELKRYCGSMERSMQEMTTEIRKLCSKIDMLALESRRDSQQSDIQEIKLLLNGLAEPPPPKLLWTPEASPRSGHPTTPNISQASFGDQVSAPPGPEGSIARDPAHDGDSNQAEYMNVLGLLANGKSPPEQQPWGAPDSNGDTARGMGQGSVGEIQVESDGGVVESTPALKDRPALTASGFSSEGWTPPALPEATINMSAEGQFQQT
ncbi:hypothetical protein BSKO_01240 [Bryopsis sp. KO-2023]|nr:hypothetical protein BSKO_01240 [Bryopsis sp. KO-2023]